MKLDGRGARGARPRRDPRRTGGSSTTIQLPPLSPSAPVRTQVIRQAALAGVCQAAACGPRVKGPDLAGTPANGGFREAAPSRNLSFRHGQRPSIHRPQRCRAPKGTRASVAAATQTVPAQPFPYEGSGSSETGSQRRRDRRSPPALRCGTRQRRSALERRPDWQGRCRSSSSSPGRGIAPQPSSYICNLTVLDPTSTHTHRPHLICKKACNSKRCQKLLMGNFLLWGWSVRGHFTYKIRAQFGDFDRIFGTWSFEKSQSHVIRPPLARPRPAWPTHFS